MIFSLKLKNTYYKNGFLNIPVKYKHLFLCSLNSIDIKIKEEKISCTINFKANKSGSPRILGGPKLAAFFQNNFKVDDIIEIEIIEKDNLKKTIEHFEINEFYRLHSHIIKRLEGFYCYLNVPNINERIIKIHHHSCGFCNYGTGRKMEGNEPGRNGAWLGPFSRIEQINDLLNQFVPEKINIKIEKCNCINNNQLNINKDE